MIVLTPHPNSLAVLKVFHSWTYLLVQVLQQSPLMCVLLSPLQFLMSQILSPFSKIRQFF